MGLQFLSEYQLAHFLNKELYVNEDFVLQEASMSSEASVERLSSWYLSLRQARQIAEGLCPSLCKPDLSAASLLRCNEVRVIH